jgi:hypothetical protein
MGFPRDDLPSYLSGENTLILDNFPELGFFRDIVYLFKVGLLSPVAIIPRRPHAA